MEQYFCVVGIKDDDAMINIVARYVTDFSLLWWQHRSTDERRGQATNETWEEF